MKDIRGIEIEKGDKIAYSIVAGQSPVMMLATVLEVDDAWLPPRAAPGEEKPLLQIEKDYSTRGGRYGTTDYNSEEYAEYARRWGSRRKAKLTDQQRGRVVVVEKASP